jgi:hypothetical protein
LLLARSATSRRCSHDRAADVGLGATFLSGGVMSLPEDEQRQLRKIEQALCRDDPRFVRLMRATDPRVRCERTLRYALIGVVIVLACSRPGRSPTASAWRRPVWCSCCRPWCGRWSAGGGTRPWPLPGPSCPIRSSARPSPPASQHTTAPFTVRRFAARRAAWQAHAAGCAHVCDSAWLEPMLLPGSARSAKVPGNRAVGPYLAGPVPRRREAGAPGMLVARLPGIPPTTTPGTARSADAGGCLIPSRPLPEGRYAGPYSAGPVPCIQERQGKRR